MGFWLELNINIAFILYCYRVVNMEKYKYCITSTFSLEYTTVSCFVLFCNNIISYCCIEKLASSQGYFLDRIKTVITSRVQLVTIHSKLQCSLFISFFLQKIAHNILSFSNFLFHKIVLGSEYFIHQFNCWIYINL